MSHFQKFFVTKCFIGGRKSAKFTYATKSEIFQLCMHYTEEFITGPNSVVAYWAGSLPTEVQLQRGGRR